MDGDILTDIEKSQEARTTLELSKEGDEEEERSMTTEEFAEHYPEMAPAHWGKQSKLS